MIPRAWKRREPGPGRCGGGGSRVRAGGGRGTENSPPAPPARSRSEIPESGARPKRRQRAAKQAAKSSEAGRELCAPRARRASAGCLPGAACSASGPGAPRTSLAPPARPTRGPEARGPCWGDRGSSPGHSAPRAPRGGRAGAAPSIRGARESDSQGTKRRKRGRPGGWRLGAAGTPESAGWSALRALRRPPPSSERRACCSVCRRRRKPFLGPGRNSGAQ